MGKRLPCTIRSVTEVRAVKEETLAVRAVGSATLALHTVTQVRVIVPTPRARGSVMIDPGPGPLGLCPVRGIVEVEQDNSIWFANTGPQPIQIEKDEVVAMAACVLAETGASSRNDRDDGDEVNGLVEQASPHLTSEEYWQLQAAMAARKHLFAKGKGNLGRTDIAPLGGHLARVTRDQGAMAPVGTVIPGRWSTTPIDGSMSWKDRDGGPSWSSWLINAAVFSSGSMEG